MSSDQPQRDRWLELAALLGIAPRDEERSSPAPSAEPAEEAVGESVHSEPTAEHSEGRAASVPTAFASPTAATAGAEGAGIGIPIRVDWKRERKAGDWEAVTAELGLGAPGSASLLETQDADTDRKEGPIATETEPRRSHAAPPWKRPKADAVALDPVCRTVEPPALPEAEMVTVTLPEADVSAVEEKVVAAESTPVAGLDLERAVVVPPELPQEVESQLAPLEAAVGEFVDEFSAVAADTITTAMVSQEGRAKRKRRRRRRKTPITINSEPFEAELPSIVAEAAAENEDEDDEDLPDATPEAVTSVAEEPVKSAVGRRDRGRHRRPREAAGSAESGTESPEDHDAADESGGEGDGESKAAHRAVPTWAETVAHVIQKNMENRRRRGGSGRGRDRS